MKYCIKCGTELPDDAVFCYKCGAKQPDVHMETKQTSQQNITIAPAGIKELKCPSCGAPLHPLPDEMTVTCEYCGTTIVLGNEGWTQLMNHTMLLPKSIDQNDAINIAKEWMDRSLIHRHMFENSKLEEISLSYVPFWIVPGSAVTNYVVEETAESAAATVGEIVGSIALSEAMTRGRGAFVMVGGGTNIKRDYQIKGDYQFPVVAVKGWSVFQPKYYEFNLSERQTFDLKKIPKNIRILNSDLGKDAAMISAKTGIEELQYEKAHKQHRTGIVSLKTEVNVAEPELLHAPIWYMKFLHKSEILKKNETIILTIDANRMQVMQEIR